MKAREFKISPWLGDKLRSGLGRASTKGPGLAILGTVAAALAGGYLMYQLKRPGSSSAREGENPHNKKTAAQMAPETSEREN